jgi:alkylation response protein AidB-like acyl-CoA dehydrogenase
MTMDWFDNDVTRSIAGTAEGFAKKELADFASAVREGKPAEGLWEKSLRSSAQLGLWLGPLPAEFGGTGMDALSCAMVVSKLSGGCAGFAAMLAVHYSVLTCLEHLLPEKSIKDAKDQHLA